MSYQNFIQPSKNFTDLAYSNELGIWNASAGTDGEILYSYDGLSWLVCTLPSLTTPKFNQIEYGLKTDGSPLFVVHAGITSSDQQYILTSIDGINYNLANSSIFCTKLVYGNGWFFAFTNNYVFRSQNGTFWEQISSLSVVGSKLWKYGTFGKNSLVVFSETGSQSCAVSYDYGVTWDQYTGPVEFSDVVFDDTKFVAVSPTTNSVYTSTDGKNWLLVNNSTSMDRLTVYYGNIIGIKPNTNTVYSSVDHGATWSISTVTNSADWSAMGTRQAFSLPISFATPIPTAATPTPTTTPVPSPTPTLAPTDVSASNINNITTNSLMPTNGFGFSNTTVTGQPVSITFTQTGSTAEYVQVQFTNNTGETITVVIGGVTYTIPPGGSFNQTVLLNPGDTVVISGPSGNYTSGELTGSVAVVAAPTPTATINATPSPTPSETPVPTPTDTPVPTASETPVPTPTDTPVPTASETPVPTPTNSPTPSPSNTPNPSPTPTFTASPTPTPTVTSSPTPSASPTPSPTPAPKIWLWGSGTSGLLGNNTTGIAPLPVRPVGSIVDFTYCISNPRSIINGVVTTDGKLLLWGANQTYGNIGDGTKIDRSSPVQIGTETNWSMIDASDTHTVAIKTDGTLWAWGDNSYGQLSNSSLVARSSPEQIGTRNDWAKCAAGQNSTYAITNAGTLWSCGKNYNGELGIGNQIDKSSFTQISGSNYVDIKAGLVFAVAKKSDNTLWLWGNNFDGQLGIGQIEDTEPIKSPVQEITARTWSNFACMNNGVIAISSGNIYTWGLNTAGCLAQGAVADRIGTPTQILFNDGTFTHVAGALDTMLARKSDGTLWGAGDKSSYELDSSSNNPPSTDSIIQVAVSKNWANVFAIQNTVTGKEA